MFQLPPQVVNDSAVGLWRTTLANQKLPGPSSPIPLSVNGKPGKRFPSIGRPSEFEGEVVASAQITQSAFQSNKPQLHRGGSYRFTDLNRRRTRAF